MSMKKAFTLSELIIALGIVGVISALCIPQLSDNIEKTRTASILGKVIKQVETGVAHYMVDDADETGASAETLLGTNNPRGFLGKYIGISSSDNVIPASITSEGSGMYSVMHFNKIPAEIAYCTNALCHSHEDQNPWLNTVDTKGSMIVEMFVDVNGFDKKPNQYGKDVFIIKILNDGRVVPNGEASDCTKDNIGDGKSCAARIVADNYKITYR